MSAWFALIVTGAAGVTGAVAAVAGAGVDSLLTPLLSLEIDMRSAVLAMTAPHLVFNALRFWTIRSKLDRRIFRRFGLTSAAGALAGSLLHMKVTSGWITGVFAVLLILAGAFGATGFADRIHLGRRGAYTGGVLSGFFGGLTGEQGGLRAAALLGFDISKEAFVATATAAALVVDAVRIPVYVATRWGDLGDVVLPSGAATIGVAVGALLGQRLLRKVPQSKFSRVVSIVLLVIGALLVVRLAVKK